MGRSGMSHHGFIFWHFHSLKRWHVGIRPLGQVTFTTRGGAALILTTRLRGERDYVIGRRA